VLAEWRGSGNRLPPERLASLTELSPGILAKQSNGPRDLGISIRGSNAKVGFGIRNIKVFEDGFPVTQSDGLSRSDIIVGVERSRCRWPKGAPFRRPDKLSTVSGRR
jgi:hypothetical protein